nr:phage holin [Enterobacter sp. 170198]
MYWFRRILDGYSLEQWTAMGVIASLVIGLLTFLTNLYFEIKAKRRRVARGIGYPMQKGRC